MNKLQALGHLIAAAINEAHRTTWGDAEGVAACCPTHCGPCGALRWFYTNSPDKADEAVRSIMECDSDGYDWQKHDGGIDWKVLLAVWARGKQLGCCEREEESSETEGDHL